MMYSKRHLPDIEQWSRRHCIEQWSQSSGSNVIPRSGLAGLRPHTSLPVGARNLRARPVDHVLALVERHVLRPHKHRYPSLVCVSYERGTPAHVSVCPPHVRVLVKDATGEALHPPAPQTPISAPSFRVWGLRFGAGGWSLGFRFR